MFLIVLIFLASSFIVLIGLLSTLKHASAQSDLGFVQPSTCRRQNIEQVKAYHPKLRFASVNVETSTNVTTTSWHAGVVDSNYKVVDSNYIPITLDNYASSGVGGGWWQRLAELQKFSHRYGHCQVPKRFAENPALGNFVNKQRQLYRRYQRGQPCSLTRERIAMLDAIGFCWTPTKSAEIVQDDNCNEAILPAAFCPSHGTNPPFNIHQHASLSVSSSSCPKARRTSVRPNDRGMHAKNSQVGNEKWWSRFLEFKAYLQASNITDLTTIPSSSTWGVWLNAQRNEYWKRPPSQQVFYRNQEKNIDADNFVNEMVKSSSRLTFDMIKALEELQFDWNYRRQQVWELRLRELREYQLQHGDTCVPITYSPNPSLAQWISRQRKNYNAKRRGLPNSLTQERIEQLEKLGFVWNRWDYEFSKKNN